MGLTYEEFEGRFNLKKKKIQPGHLEILLREVWTPAYDSSFVVYSSLRDVSVTLNMACITCHPDIDLEQIEKMSEEELSLIPYFGYSWPVVVEQRPPRAWNNLFGIIPRPVIKQERLVRKLLSFDGKEENAYGPDLVYFLMEVEGSATKVRVRADSQEDAERLTAVIRGFNAFVEHLNEYPSTWKDRLRNPEKYKTE
jgi:hypothetical protein